MKTTEFLSNLKKLSKEDILSIKGIGDVLAQNFVDFTESKRYLRLTGEFTNLESMQNSMDIQTNFKKPIFGPLSRENICITGTFSISRESIKTQLEEKGAKVIDTVSKNTTILLAGEKAGGKLEKAKKLGIHVVDNLANLL